MDRDLLQDFKDLFEPKIWVSKVNVLLKIIMSVLVIIGILLIVNGFLKRSELDEFFVIPIILGIVDFIAAYILFIKNVGYKIYFTGRDIIVSKWAKEIARINMQRADIIYKKRFLYDILEFYVDKNNVFSCPSYWFKKNEFENLKDFLFKIRKYYKSL